jgi:hypothetical protein
MKQEAVRPLDDRVSQPQPVPTKTEANPLASVPRPKMRVVSKGWNYREELLTQEQVEARIREQR